jgi:hypothetical protein
MMRATRATTRVGLLAMAAVLTTCASIAVADASPSGAAAAKAHAVPKGAVAVVAGTTVSRAEVRRWQGIFKRAAGTPAIGQLLDGDSAYRACVASIMEHGTGTQAARALEAKRFCGQARSLSSVNARVIRRDAVRLVIQSYWITGDARREHEAVVTRKQVEHAIAAARKVMGAKRYAQIKRRLGITGAELRTLERTTLAVGTWSSLSVEGREAADRFRKRWSSRTICAPRDFQPGVCSST